MSERFNPYKDLQRAATEFARKVKYRKRVVARAIPENRLREAFTLDIAAEQVATAKMLGYETHLELNDNGDLLFIFVERAPVPTDWRFTS